VQVAFFSAGGSISKEFAPSAVKAGAVVVDNTSYFRMKDGIPLVVPEVNGDAIAKHNGLIANPNCCTIIMVVPLWPLHKVNRIKRVVVSTYQSVSGAGAWGLYELDAQMKAYATGQPIAKEKFPHQIVNNLFSHNTKVADNGYNEEENKMVAETRKIFADPKIQVSPTCIRVPIPRAHSESINIEFERPMSPEQVRAVLSKAPGVKIVDDRERTTSRCPLKRAGRTTCSSVASARTSAAMTGAASTCSSAGTSAQGRGDERGADCGEARLARADGLTRLARSGHGRHALGGESQQLQLPRVRLVLFTADVKLDSDQRIDVDDPAPHAPEISCDGSSLDAVVVVRPGISPSTSNLPRSVRR
jgi:aspartate-semialdehyde dehydrogenase